MYELFMGQLLKVETFESPNQPNGQAIIKNTVATVTGYDIDETLFFETIPSKNEPENKTGELHYINNELVWVYVDKPKDLTEQVENLKEEDLNNKEAIAELYLLALGGF